MIISGLSGNEVYCLALKGFTPGPLTVGNSVQSLGFAGSLGSSFRAAMGGEIRNVTQMISEGRHAAIRRMAEEAQRHSASGVSGVTSELKSLSGYTEFLSLGTAVTCTAQMPFFTSSASGTELYCHLDAGYTPRQFVMGNVAYALGIGRGLTGSLRQMAKGEVKEFSEMYNGLRHLALQRLKEEAAAVGANSVVDVRIDLRPFGAGVAELLMTGTAAYHPRLAQGNIHPQQVVTSELTGSELWNLAKLGYAPIELVMATSVYSIGLVGGIGTLFSGLASGELNELTRLIYHARENCLALVGQEAEARGAERVVGNRLHIRELGQGMIEVIASGTALRRMDGIAPQSELLIPQAMIREEESLSINASGLAALPEVTGMGTSAQRLMSGGRSWLGCLAVLLFFGISTLFSVVMSLMQ